MKYTNNPMKYMILGGSAVIFIFGAAMLAPASAHAFELGQLIDPACLFACNNKPKKVTQTYTYTNSNNVNSNINSPNAIVVGASQPIAYNTTPVYNYNTYPVYNYPPVNQGPLQVSCYPQPLSARVGDNTSWLATAYGGNGSYNYTWTGTDGLSGYGSAVSKTYYASGYKNASVTVISGNQTISKNCDGTINIYGDYSYPQPQPYPQYYPPYNTYPTVTVSCYAAANYANTNSITWNAYASGGNGSYSYSWSGSDGLYGSNQSIYYTYPNPGQKYASVTVYSNGQSSTQSCGTVNISNYYALYPNYPGSNNNSGLDIGCFADPVTARVNQPVTWRAEVVGGVAPYTYTWTGSNDLSGSDSSVIKYYSSTGDKNAIVSIRSADGKTATRACTTNLTIHAAASAAPATPAAPAVQPGQNDNNPLSAAALFSLKNVPWGWVAILIILVLFGTVVYLLFNRKEI